MTLKFCSSSEKLSFLQKLKVFWSLPDVWKGQNCPVKYPFLKDSLNNRSLVLYFFFVVEAFFLKQFSFQQIGPFETTSAELRELRTGRPYMVQVCAQELLGLGECSEWSEAVNVTVPKVKL